VKRKHVTSPFELPGKLISHSASRFFRATQELLKWQIPVVAASELLAVLALVLRNRFLQPARPATRH
jgi:hypothetical protein